MLLEGKYIDSGCGEQSKQKEGAGVNYKVMTQKQKAM